jgi:cytochrome c-type biogenesis protein CcmF
MNLGQVLIATGLAGSITALVSYVLTARGKSRWLVPARLGHIVMTLCLAASVALLMNLVLNHRFEYTYVYRYSSTDLPLHFLVSTFWAGQEGTFLLWAVYTAILGLIVMRTGKKFEPGVMSFVLVLQTFLLLILVKLSPFATYPVTPPEGAGLNPLLQDYWMVIHPPLLFVGFASFTIPAAFAMHAMARGDTDEWVKGALPWTAFGVLVLGTAICLGGYWAYRTLGWGGYWGWDPVENSSLVPWMFGVALLHGLVVQTRKGALKRSNLFLAVSAFMLILYSTFLTRSGVLGDFSVHSFVDLGINGLLIAFVAVYGVLGFGLYFWRLRGMRENKLGSGGVLTREYGMFLGALTVLIFATVILIGTSAPLLTRIGGTPSNVAMSYYHVTAVPFGILITLLMSVAPLLMWGTKRTEPLWKSLLSPVLLALLTTVLFVLLGVRKPHHVALVFSASTALYVNLEIILATIRRSGMRAGGFIVHVGMALMILGIVTSTVYDREESVILPRGQMAQVFGYRLIWTGERPFDDGTTGDKTAYDITVMDAKDRNYTASPVMFYSAYNNGVMRRPGILRFPREDLYLAPQAVDRDQALDKMEKRELTLQKGETAVVGGTTIQFVGFEPRAMSNEKIEMAAVLDVSAGGRTETVKPVVAATPDGQVYEEVIAAVDGSKIVVRRVDPGNNRALLYVRQPGSLHYDLPSDALYVEASVKPFIGILWIGTFVGIAGLILTVVYRARSAALAAKAVRARPKMVPTPAPAGAAPPEPREAGAAVGA